MVTLCIRSGHLLPVRFAVHDARCAINFAAKLNCRRIMRPRFNFIIASRNVSKQPKTAEQKRSPKIHNGLCTFAIELFNVGNSIDRDIDSRVNDNIVPRSITPDTRRKGGGSLLFQAVIFYFRSRNIAHFFLLVMRFSSIVHDSFLRCNESQKSMWINL